MKTKNRRHSQSGQGIIELALLLMLVALVAVIALHFLGDSLSRSLNDVSSGFKGNISTQVSPTPTSPADCQQGHGQPTDNGKCNGH